MFKPLCSSKCFSGAFPGCFSIGETVLKKTSNYHQREIEQADLGQFCSLILPHCYLTWTWMFSMCGSSAELACLTERLHVFWSHGKFTSSGPILGIFCFLLCSFPPFLQWFFFCFHLPCSGNNKADFYLYAQMLGRSNLVGLLYISLPLSLSPPFFCFPLCPPYFSMCHWTIIALFCRLQIELLDHYHLIISTRIVTE